MDLALITALLSFILAGMFSQTIAVWVALGNIKKNVSETRDALEKKIDSSKCPFGVCPLYERSRIEAAESRILPKD